MLPDQSRSSARRLLVALVVAPICAALGAGVLPAGATAPAAARAARVHLSISAPGSVAQGQKVAIAGTSSPADAGKVKLQIRYSRSAPWITVKGKRVRTGSFVFTDKVSTNRTRWYRFMAIKMGKKSYSRSARVKVGKASAPAPAPAAYKWYDLYDIQPFTYSGIYNSSSLRINGGYYTKSLTSDYDSTRYREYNLSRLCTQLTGVAGLNDDKSDGPGIGKVRLLNDGTEVYAQQFGLGQAEQLALSVANVLRLRIEFYELTTGDSTKDANPAIGSPRVYCSTSIELGSD